MKSILIKSVELLDFAMEIMMYSLVNSRFYKGVECDECIEQSNSQRQHDQADYITNRPDVAKIAEGTRWIASG